MMKNLFLAIMVITVLGCSTALRYKVISDVNGREHCMPVGGGLYVPMSYCGVE